MMKKIVMAVLALIMMNGVVYALDSAKQATLLFMYQEEKLARDVYITLGKLYPAATTFSNIQLSEQTHVDTVENLGVMKKNRG
jgi:hypothetical protein